MKKIFANARILRFFFIPLLKMLNVEFRWKHDLTNRAFYLQLYYHKGYWFYGRDREKEELEFFQKLIVKGGSVLEVGTHIGYLTQYFEHLVGASGQVLAVEPTPSSVHYLKKNVRPNTIVVEKAASNTCGEVEFFTEEFGGLTNSLVAEFTQSQNESHQKSQHVSSRVSSITVETDTFDNICSQNNFVPNFIKIDVEGAEHDVLNGAKHILEHANAIMVEISRNGDEVLRLLANFGFKRLNDLKGSENYFFVKDC